MMEEQANPYKLPENLPPPIDDGRSDHLEGMSIPDINLPAMNGQTVSLADQARGRAIVYFYPATGVPGKDPAPIWDSIPGAPGCTVQALGFRQRYNDFQNMGINVLGISTQSTEEQKEFSDRNHIPFLIVSDYELKLTRLLDLPTFEVDSTIFLKRLVLFIEEGVIRKVFYPVFPPDKSADDILSWLLSNSE